MVNGSEWQPEDDPRETREPPTAMQVLFDSTLRDLVYAVSPIASVRCTLCADPRIEQAWYHRHAPDGLHWHHRIDPGDGLPSPCTASPLFTRLFLALQDELIGTDGAGRDIE